MQATEFYDKYGNIYNIRGVLNSDGVTNVDKKCDPMAVGPKPPTPSGTSSAVEE